MSNPVRVAVVRRRRDPAEQWAFVLLTIGFAFLNAWLLMLIVGTVTPWHPSYWHTVLALLGLRLIQTGSGWMQWTWPGRKGEDK